MNGRMRCWGNVLAKSYAGVYGASSVSAVAELGFLFFDPRFAIETMSVAFVLAVTWLAWQSEFGCRSREQDRSS